MSSRGDKDSLFIKSDNPLNFFDQTNPERGKDWFLPPAFSLPRLPSDDEGNRVPGFGCFASPNATVGFPLFKNATTDCAPGFFCPYYVKGNPATIPVSCPPDPACQITRLQGGVCMPQGRYEPMACMTGFYCPNSSTILPCPAGYTCTRGSVAPKRCQPLSYCPAGATLETHYGLVLIAILFDVLLFGLLLLFRIRELRRAKQPLSALIPPFITALTAKLSRGRRAASSPSPKPSDKVQEEGGVRIEDDTDPEAGQGRMGITPSPAPTVVGESERMQENVRRLVDGFRSALGENRKMDFGFTDLSLRLPSGVPVLQGVTGEIRAGRMTAIMGPSGAGKTTFMNVLMGKVSRTGGELRINGRPAEMQQFKKLIGYVPQEDVMHRELTVEENIAYSAKIRLPRSWTNQEVKKHVEHVVDALNLTKVKHSPIGDDFSRGISGGQRKRVNVGMELAATPLALFLDEPTSGLDSTAALDLSSILRSISRLGLTIVSVIHQPRMEIFRSFDDVLLIAPGGRTAYFGPVDKVQGYFESLGFHFDKDANVADVLMDVLSGRGVSRAGGATPSTDDVVRAWEIHMSKSERRRLSSQFATPSTHLAPGNLPKQDRLSIVIPGASTPIPVDAPQVDGDLELAAMSRLAQDRGASFLKQTFLAHQRSLLQQIRQSGALLTEFFVAGFAGTIMGISAAQAREPYQGLLQKPYLLGTGATLNWYLGLYGMLIGIAISLSGGPAGVKVFGEEKPVYWREAASGHNTLSYYIGKSVSVIYRLALAALHFTSVYLFLGRPSVDAVTQFLLILLNFFFIYGIAAVISLVVRRENASLVTVIVGLFGASFCGFGLKLTDAEKGGYIFVFNLGANRWAAEAQYYEWIKNYANIFDLDEALAFCGYKADRLGMNLAVMLALGIGYRILGYGLLVGLNRQKQK
ncbi:hypothetical protein HDU96_007268 [Phlyctochytrium bullatum]|nr:hypothetical protein HDU96_007268 [Phlyctochytrium bullatum]